MEPSPIRTIAFYLPQYHPIPENDAWWGKGFTDWMNVRKGQPRFIGHYQPHVPGELGYYDLLDPTIRERQAGLAKEYGVDAFCYYHYWFNAHRLLGKPLDAVLASNKPDFPFCLCWANENWTRAWDGGENQILIAQKHNREDDRAHIEWLIPVFRDSRYVRIHDKPLFLIYRADAIPDVKGMISAWRSRTTDAGLADLYLCAVRSNFSLHADKALIDLGFDAVVDFQPNIRNLPEEALWRKIIRYSKRSLQMAGHGNAKSRCPVARVYNYRQLVRRVMAEPVDVSCRRLPCVFPSWDNTARRAESIVIQNTNPALFGQWLLGSSHRVASFPPDEQMVFINAWNEWAEGCHLEPDQRMGRAFLEEVRKVKETLNAEPRIL
jgi:lipopolysaccharide biosynthesis protein